MSWPPSPITSGPIAISDYWDRNPLRIVRKYQALQGNHAATQRFTYTVPAGRHAFILSAHCRCENDSGVSMNNNAFATIYVIDGANQLALCVGHLINNDPNFYTRHETNVDIGIIPTGTQIDGITVNYSARNVTFFMDLVMIEFDA